MSHPINTTVQGNSLEKLKLIPSASADTCITSPPYFGLRDYGTAEWIGGDNKCNHKIKKSAKVNKNHTGASEPLKDFCIKCGAIRKDDQIGCEETPEQYIEKLVAIFNEVFRILKPHGTLWLNLGDSYYAKGNGSIKQESSTLQGGKGAQIEAGKRPSKINLPGLKPKDLIGIPWMVAFALRDAGWYLRSSIIWAKPNPMPESVRDCPTKAHEDIFLFSKNKNYYYDQDAIRTEPTENTIARMSQQIEKQKGSTRAVGFTNGTMKAVGQGKNVRPNVDTKGGNQGSILGIPAMRQRGHVRPQEGIMKLDQMTKEEQQANGANKKSVWSVDSGVDTWLWMYENFPKELVDPIFEQYCYERGFKTDVWEVTTKPFKEAHFAVFPEDLIIDCIKAGTSEHGCCSKCGKPYVRVTEPVFDVKHTGETNTAYDGKSSAGRLAKLRQAAREAGMEYNGQRKTIGWEPTCKCENAEVVPAVVIDPFCGSGTVKVTSRKLGRNYRTIELNKEYIKIGDKRMFLELGFFA